MRGFVLHAFDAPPALRDDLPEPAAPTDREVVVRVHASSVNGADAAIAGGRLKEMVSHDFPVTLGRDFAGAVQQVGASVRTIRVGDEVFGFLPAANPTVHAGSWTELISIPEGMLAAMPRSAEMAQAGAAPLAAVTALAALDVLAPAEGECVLVIGATGGVGSFFVQVAAKAGARVIAPALPEDVDYLRGLGVAEVLDRGADLDTAIRETSRGGVDAILDVASFAPQDAVLKATGRLASALGAAGDGPGRFNIAAQPATENLSRVAELLDGGTLRVPLRGSYDLGQAGEALATFTSTHTQGKLGIDVSQT